MQTRSAIAIFLCSAFFFSFAFGYVGSGSKLRNPIRDRHIQKPGLCFENYNSVNRSLHPFKLYRYHRDSAKCFMIGEKGPCGKNMIFYRIGNFDFGECDCDMRKQCGRPLLYWKEANACFHANTQGPCPPGQWVVYGLTQRPICQKQFCLLQEKDNPSNHRARKFWITVNGQCIKTRSRGFCPDPDQVMFFKQGDGYPRCVYGSDATVCNTVDQKNSRPCCAGSKCDVEEHCREKVGLWGNEDDH